MTNLNQNTDTWRKTFVLGEITRVGLAMFGDSFSTG